MNNQESAMQDLRIHAQATPNRIALFCDGQSISYGELESMANRMAHVFRMHGLKRGDHVGLRVGNRAEVLALAWAAWRTGIYLTPFSVGLTNHELSYLTNNCEAKLVIIDCKLQPDEPKWAPSEVIRLALGGAIRGCRSLDDLLVDVPTTPISEECPGSLMMYTSGTTGAPKGVYRPLLPADWKGTPPFASDLIDLFKLDGTDVRYLSTAPLYHAAPLRVALTVTAAGGYVHIMDNFDARTALNILRDEFITHSQWVPTMFQRLLSLPQEQRSAFTAPAHRRAIHGAAPCPASLKQQMIDWWGPILFEYYSGSEGIGLTSIESEEALTHPGSVGRVRKGSLHTVDPETHVEIPHGQTGLICFSGVKPFEYFNAPEKTASRTLPNGWQTFGDLGHVDEDGYLYLTDRVDDMIISGGVNIYPQEIELVARNIPGVRDCAVVGVPDEKFGERPVAFVELDDRYVFCADPRDLIKTGFELNLGRVKRPDAIYIVNSLPYTPTGKLLRRKLRKPE